VGVFVLEGGWVGIGGERERRERGVERRGLNRHPPTETTHPPGLPQLYGYMLANRRKVLGGGPAKKAKAV
jgi:hypothetical protein